MKSRYSGMIEKATFALAALTTRGQERIISTIGRAIPQDTASKERIALHDVFQRMSPEEIQQHIQNFRLFLTALTDNTHINNKSAAVYLQEQLWKAAPVDKYTFIVPPMGLTPFEFALDTGTEIAGENPLIYLDKQYRAVDESEKPKYKIPQELPISTPLTLVSPDQYVLHNFNKLSKAKNGLKIDDSVLTYFHGLYKNGKYSSEDFLKLLDLSVAQGHKVNCSKFINVKDGAIENPEFLIHFHKQYEAWNGDPKSNPYTINDDIPFEWAHTQKLKIGGLSVATHFYNSNILVDERNVFAMLVESYELEDEDQGRKRYECDGLSPQEYIIQHPDILIDGQPGIVWLIANNEQINNKATGAQDAIEYAIEKNIGVGSVSILKYCIDNNIPVNSEPPAIWAQRKLKLGGKSDIYCIDGIEPVEHAVLKMFKEGKKEGALDLFRAAVKSGINFNGTEILKILEAESNKSYNKLPYTIDLEKQTEALQLHPLGDAGAELPSPMTEALAYDNIIIDPSIIIEHFKKSTTETDSAFVARLVEEKQMDVLKWIAKNDPKFLLDNGGASKSVGDIDMVRYLQGTHKELTDNIQKQEKMVKTGRPVQAANIAMLRRRLHKAELEYNNAVGTFIKTQHKELINNASKRILESAENEEAISKKIKVLKADKLEKEDALKAIEKHFDKEYVLQRLVKNAQQTVFNQLEAHLSRLETEHAEMRTLIKLTQANLDKAKKGGDTKLSSILSMDLEKREKLAKQQGVKIDLMRQLIHDITDIENITMTKQSDDTAEIINIRKRLRQLNDSSEITEASKQLQQLEKELAAAQETSNKGNYLNKKRSLRESILANGKEIGKLVAETEEITKELRGFQLEQITFMNSSEENARKSPKCLKLQGEIEGLQQRISESEEVRREKREYAYQQAGGMLQAFGGMSPARYLLNEALEKGNEVEVSWKLLAAKEMSVPEFLSVMGIDVENLKKNNKPNDRAKKNFNAIIQFLKECPIEDAKHYLDTLKFAINNYTSRPGAPKDRLEQNINKNLSQLEKQAEEAVNKRLAIKAPTFIDKLFGRRDSALPTSSKNR